MRKEWMKLVFLGNPPKFSSFFFLLRPFLSLIRAPKTLKCENYLILDCSVTLTNLLLNWLYILKGPSIDACCLVIIEWGVCSMPCFSVRFLINNRYTSLVTIMSVFSFQCSYVPQPLFHKRYLNTLTSSSYIAMCKDQCLLKNSLQ